MSDDEQVPVPVPGLSQVGDLLALGQFERARELAGTVLAQSPSDPVALASLARVHLASGNADAAQAAIDTSLAQAPDSSAIHLLRGTILLRRGRFAEAERAYLSAVELEPDEAMAHYCLAELLWICDEEARALPVITKALELDPDDAEAHQLLAQILLATNPRQWDLSLEASTRALALDPEDSQAHAVHGAALLHAGRREEAEEAFRTSLERDPSNRLAVHGLTEALLSLRWWYRPLFQIQLWQRRYGNGAAAGAVLGLWFAVSAATAFLSRIPGLSPVSTGLVLLYLGFCAYTWFATPVTRALLARQYPWMRNLP